MVLFLDYTIVHSIKDAPKYIQVTFIAINNRLQGKTTVLYHMEYNDQGIVCEVVTVCAS
jgi:hypothetical protein